MNNLLLALLMLMGWLNASHFSPWVSWHSEVPVFLMVLLMALSLALRRFSQGAAEVPSALALPAMLGLILSMQAALGLIASHGQFFVVALYLLVIAVSIVWGWCEAREPSRPMSIGKGMAGAWLAWALIVGGLLSVAIALAQVLELWEGVSFIARLAYIRRPGGNLAQPNHLATLLVMAQSAALFLHAQRQLGNGVLALLAVVFTAGLAVTESRSGLLASLALWSFWAWKRPATGMTTPRPWSLVGALGAVAAFAAWPSVYQWYTDGLNGGEAGLERFSSSGGDPRWELWRQMFHASQLKPWFGWGIRNTAEAHNSIAHESTSVLAVTYSHNLLLDAALWVGWPLAMGLALAATMWVWRRLKVVGERPLAWFGMALLVPFGVHSLLEFPFAYAYLLVPAMLGVGYVEGATQHRALMLRLPRLAIALMLTTSCVLGAWSVVDYVRVEEDFRVARFQMLRIGPPPTESPPRILLLNQLSDLVASTRVPLKPDLSPAQMGLLRGAALHYPWSGSQYRYATALALNGDPFEARRQMHVLRAQQGFRTYRNLAKQLERDLAAHGLPPLGIPLERPQ